MSRARNGRRVLAVEDDPNIMRVIIDTLEAAGYEVAGAREFKDALDCLEGAHFDAAILDFALPGMSGVDLHREIRERDPALAERTIFISGLLQSREELPVDQEPLGIACVADADQVQPGGLPEVV